ncbi:hypothetical protein [Streptomyces sp. NPDC088789]|uniref:hypothetical protein n=1 Tax=Streptomyces sp. NPDC088789 TaxID=3365899 RepID=UPI0038278182
MSLTEFKRRIQVGQRVTVVNYLHPHASGERTVDRVGSRGLKTKSENAESPWAVKWPRQGLWRIEGDTLHFLHETDPGRVVFSYTFHFDTEEQAEQEASSVRTRYRVTWVRTGNDTPRTDACLVDSAEMTRPGDPQQRDHLIRLQLAKDWLPLGEMDPQNVTLSSVQPVCNCENPELLSTCDFATHQGVRFYLTTSQTYAGCEVIHDRHNDKIIGIVSITESVEFLTQIREKYGHQ